MKNYIYDIWAKFLTWFGKIKVFFLFKFIPILVYDPDPNYVDGYSIAEVMGMAQPGDVLIRGYNKYLDGKFIPDERGYSHAGLYIGGDEMVHAVSPCVQRTHVIDFCQADRVMLLRPCSGQKEAVQAGLDKVGVPYDFDYRTDIGRLYCFELIAACYPQAGLKTHVVKKLFGLVKRDCYIAKSIYGSPFFGRKYERNDRTDSTRTGE